MAKKRSRKGRARKRDAKGHFLPQKGRKRSAKRHVKRVRKGLGRHAKTGQYRKHRRHAVKAHTRKVRGKRVRVRRHLSHEEPKRPRRRKRARAQEESTMSRRRRRRARRHHASEAPKRRRRRRHAAAEAPRRRRRRRHHTAMANPRKRRRARKGRRRAGRKLKTSALCRRSSRRRPKYVYTKRASTSHRRRRGHRRAPAGSYPEAMPSEYALENPMSGSELLLAAVTGTLGFAAADFLDRYLAQSELGPGGSSLATGQTGINADLAVLSKPGIMRILSQAGAAAAPLALAYYVKQPAGRAALQGAGLGALVHLGGQLWNHYVMAKYFGASAPTAGTFTATVNAMYSPEMLADNAANAATGGSAAALVPPTGYSIAGLPNRGIGRALGAARGPRAHMVPVANRGVGQCAGCAAASGQGGASNGAIESQGECGPPGSGTMWPTPGGNGGGGGAPGPGMPLPPMNGGGNGVYQPGYPPGYGPGAPSGGGNGTFPGGQYPGMQPTQTNQPPPIIPILTGGGQPGSGTPLAGILAGIAADAASQR